MRRAAMKWETLLCLMLVAAWASAADAPPASAPPSEVIPVATALEHLTVIECGEPVTMVATGSAGFQIARRDDKVLIKPLESGVATDLFVWTATRRFIYELEPPGEAREMNFVVDNRVPPKPQPPAGQADQEAIDSLARAFLAAQPIDTRAVRDRKRGVTVRVEHMLLAKSRVYLHYSVSNMGKRSYRLETPRVEQLLAHPAKVYGRRVQLRDRNLDKLVKTLALTVANVQAAAGELGPGESAECVIVLDGPLPPGAVLELNFAPEGSRPVQAVVVL